MENEKPRRIQRKPRRVHRKRRRIKANHQQKGNNDSSKTMAMGITMGCGGCFLGLLMMFLVGFGGCVGLFVVSNFLDDMQENKDAQKSVQVFQEIQTRIANNQATANDYYLLAYMVHSYEMRQKIGIKTLDSDKLYLDYLQQAIDKGSPEAKLDYADFLFEESDNITDKDLDNKEKKEKYLQLEQAIKLNEEVFNTQCEVYRKPRYPKFYNYSKGKVSVEIHRDIFLLVGNENLKSAYPELYQRAKKIEKTYQENCEKEK